MGRIFPGNICWCPRREDVLKISSGHFAKTSLKTKNCFAEDVFKMSSRHVKAYLEDVLETNKVFTGKEYTSVSNKS